MTTADIIAESVRSSLEQVSELNDRSELEVTDLARSIGRNAVAVLRADPVSFLLEAARSLSANVLRAEVSFYPSDRVGVRLQVETEADVADLGALLGCGAPAACSVPGRTWLEAQRGGYGDRLQITVTGGHREVSLPAARRVG